MSKASGSSLSVEEYYRLTAAACSGEKPEQCAPGLASTAPIISGPAPSSLVGKPQPRRAVEKLAIPARAVGTNAEKVPYIPAPGMVEGAMAYKLREIDYMTHGRMQTELRNLSMDPRGHRDTLARRLKDHYRSSAEKAAMSQSGRFRSNAPNRWYDYLMVIDFECTCEDKIFEYEHEIIEFPVVLVDTKRLMIVDEFHSYVKPKINPKLSEFCTKLTGIGQELVDFSRPFLDVLDSFRLWAAKRKLELSNQRVAIVTDGPWDISKFLQLQCLISGMDGVPHDLRYYINLRRAFTCLVEKEQRPRGANVDRPRGHHPVQDWKNLAAMLQHFGMEFEGREHSGLDDSRNIARIVLRMLKDGCELRVNERLLRRDKADKMMEKRMVEMENRGPRVPRGQYAAFVPDKETAAKRRQENEDSLAKRVERGELSKEDKERHYWREYLPYRVVSISKSEFLTESYRDCETCDESSPNEDECGERKSVKPGGERGAVVGDETWLYGDW